MSKGAHKYLIDRAVQPNVLSIFFWSVHIIHLILWNMLRFFNPVLWLSSYETIVATIVTIMAGLKEKVWLPLLSSQLPCVISQAGSCWLHFAFAKLILFSLGKRRESPLLLVRQTQSYLWAQDCGFYLNTSRHSPSTN